MKWKMDVALATTLTAALLYFLGTAQDAGFNRALGIEHQALQHPIEDTMLGGFYAGLNSAAPWVVTALLLAELTFLLPLALFAIRLIRPLNLRARMYRMRAARQRNAQSKMSREFDRWFSDWVRKMMPLAGAFLVFALMVGVPVVGNWQGKRAAERFLQKQTREGAARKVVLENGKAIDVITSIGCDETSCLYLMRDRVIRLKRDFIRMETGGLISAEN